MAIFVHDRERGRLQRNLKPCIARQIQDNLIKKGRQQDIHKLCKLNLSELAKRLAITSAIQKC